jgi:hypothetical protein
MTFDGNKQSLNDHSHAMSLEENIFISKQSIHQKFNANSVAFVKKILADHLTKQIDISSLPGFDNFSAVYIQDSTKFKLPHSAKNSYPGYHQAGASIQLTMDIKNNEFNSISIHPETYNDAKEASNLTCLREGSLIIRDLGYFSVEGFKAISAKGSFFLSRLQPKTVLYKDESKSSERFDIADLLASMKKKEITSIEKELYITYAKIPARVCFFLVPDNIREKRIREARKYAKSRGWNMSKEYEMWAGFNAFITNADNEKLPLDLIKDVYKIRWQIELIFKTWKSFYNIQKYKSMKIERIECYLYASLLKIIIDWRIMNIARRYLDAFKENISFIKFIKVMISIEKIIYDMIKGVKESISILIQTLLQIQKKMVTKEPKLKCS